MPSRSRKSSAVARSARAVDRPSAVSVARERRQRDVGGDRLRQGQPKLAAVLGQVGDAQSQRHRRASGCRPAGRRARSVPVSAGAMPNRARPTSVRPAPTRPAKPSTSPRWRSKETSVKAPVRPRPRTAQHDLAGLVVVAGEEVATSRGRPSRGSARPRVTSAPAWVEMWRPSRNTVMRSAMREDLVEAVADEEHGHALVAQPAHLAEQLLDLVGRQRGGGLVHDQHPHVERDGLGDLDRLLGGDGQAAGRACAGRCARRAGPGSPLPRVHMRRQCTTTPRSRWPMKMFSATSGRGRSAAPGRWRRCPGRWASAALCR